jgi:hypothetical protein
MASAPEPLGGRPAGSPRLNAGWFREEFREELVRFLDLRTWSAGRDLDEEYRRIEAEVRQAVAQEGEYQRRVRELVQPVLADLPDAPPGAGLHRVSLEEIADVHRGLLFNGAVEACDGTSQVHDSLALTIHQVGVSLVSYRGEQRSWQQRLFRRDLRVAGPQPEQVIGLLERRARREGLHEEDDDPLSQLARRGLMSYAERAVLAREAKAPWRLGHGSPAPLELVGADFTDLAIESIKVIRELIGHGRFVFVASEPRERDLLTIGQALYPLEYAVIGRLPDLLGRLEDWSAYQPATVDTRWDGEPLEPEGWVRRFLQELAPQIVYGVYRATLVAPPQLFYAHVDHSAVAARVALADSVFLEERGFPALIDLADRVCNSVYGGGSLKEMAAAAYAQCDAPFRYGSERRTRPV